MNKAKKKKGRLTRRQFLFSSAVGVGCLSVGLKEALAQAEITRKPILTEENLNKLLKAATPQEAQTMANLAKTDLLAFLTKYFTLTPAQTQWVKTMTPEEKQLVLTTINKYLNTNQRFSVKFIQPSSTTKAGPGVVVRKTLEIEW